MHSLEVIEYRQNYAAGREMAHAFNDGDVTQAQAINAAALDPQASSLAILGILDGWERGRQEG
jgi:hypothetical protein